MDEEDIFPVICPKKTYSKPVKKVKTSESNDMDNIYRRPGQVPDPGVPLTTKVAVEYLLSGKLKTSVCRYCLKVTVGLSELDQIMQIAGTGALYKVTIRQMIACFYPFKARQEESFPEKICQKCLDRAINAYLFTQQCEQAERALHNCFDDMNEKFNKLDPIDKKKRRGRQKLNPNTNTLYAEHNYVMDYAEPMRNIINLQTESLTNEPAWNEFECKKCWQVLPDLESLLNHEQIHPKYMWYNCRLCGKSFVKINQLKRHFNQVHVRGKGVTEEADKTFKCKECGNVTENYIQHLQHVEKHKFKSIMKHLIEKKTDQLCLVCLKKSSDLVELDKMVCIHGSCPELVGDKSLYTVLASTLPDMEYLHKFIGTKICDQCLNHALTSYIFINQFIFTRERLDLCVSLMLKNLNEMRPSANVFVQVSPPVIMPPAGESEETLLLDENEFIDESKIKIDVLEDEFRLKSESESESEPEGVLDSSPHKRLRSENSTPEMENLASNATKTYMKRKMVNGLQSSRYSVDVCSEFLTFNKRKKVEKAFKFTCPLCSKHFISEYFLKRHILKHVNKKVYCNICHDVFKSKFYLYEHTKMAHLLNESFYMSCKVCGRNFTDTDKLQTHEEKHRIKPCELCNKVYTTQAHYENHIQRHAVKLKLLKEKQSQTCSFCEKECANDNELSVHVNKIHLQIKPYSCDMCDRQFYTETNLKNHKKVHSMPSKEKCEFCGKTLRSRRQLVIHVRKHIGAKPFCCQVCGQAFYSAYKVREHMRISHGGRFCCRICKSIFATKYDLKDHVSRDHNVI
ncbi:hypothetical protein PYW07_010679 [Mythimna separata]|uniref:Uncharacterized protein n=1 Tax=Mythimna separata TaxID=271217 RepID=A0AAD8DL12_MYTSE|nr:hypothetical protein PYW07_010679 [Mythimna separata]